MHALKRRLAIHRRQRAFQQWPAVVAALITDPRLFLSKAEVRSSKDLRPRDVPRINVSRVRSLVNRAIPLDPLLWSGPLRVR
uniref:hypothetical protein n=1 Tax=Streptomyces zhihengii TaxID=1818004 RepID=UPI0036DD227A